MTTELVLRKVNGRRCLCVIFFFLNDSTVPLSISTFVFNHRISAMMFLTGNFLNASDRDGLRGRPLDPMLLSASDKTRCKLSGSSASEAVASS